MAETLLEVKNLQTHFYTRSGVAKAVEDVSFTLNESETLGLVGESGCGKSVTSLSIMRLISPPGKVVGGEILYKGDDILDMDQEDLYKLRGGQIAMIFQDPMTSLNPVLPIGFQIAEAVKAHLKMDDTAAMNRAAEMLDRVRIPEARRRLKDYPHQFSGGMRQRVMIAIALSCNPQILIADEPTTALDVTIQAQVLDLMKGLATEFRTATLLITHDLGVVAGTCDRVCVMYAGRVVETAPTAAIFKTPAHPYTQALLAAVPRPEQQRGERLAAIGGQPPNLVNLPPGCPFAPRCRKAQPRCRQELPLLENVGPNQRAACFYPY
ncbi:MAG TPA: ABC transporter ATP-binding protein [Ktedonobacterales bacterium]|jgi:oligopeptide transport system ATP-binding protein|nr:ABC transporter ATP-binding protein [Ktedonobacterales bacterium]